MKTDHASGLLQQVHEGNEASFSACQRYRYDLRWLAAEGDDYETEACIFIMLNPSTADAFKLDPTNRRCFDFTRRERAKYMHVLNVFAYRATDPKDMKAHDDPVGPENDRYLRDVLERAKVGGSKLICAWGAHGSHLGRSEAVRQMIAEASVEAQCFGLTKAGEPKHPLYLRRDTPLVAFR